MQLSRSRELLFDTHKQRVVSHEDLQSTYSLHLVPSKKACLDPDGCIDSVSEGGMTNEELMTIGLFFNGAMDVKTFSKIMGLEEKLVRSFVGLRKSQKLRKNDVCVFEREKTTPDQKKDSE